MFMLNSRQILNPIKKKYIVFVGITSLLFIVIYISTIYYKIINVYEPIEIKVEPNLDNIYDVFSVTAITPLNRSFNLVFENESYSSSFAFVKSIRFYISDSLLKEDIQFSVEIGESINVYNIDLLKEKWNYLGVENGIHVFEQSDFISKKNIFQVLSSILYWDITKDLLRYCVIIYFCIILLLLFWILITADKKKAVIFPKKIMILENTLVFSVTVSSLFISSLFVYIALRGKSGLYFSSAIFIIIAILIFIIPQIIIWRRRRSEKFANILLSIQSFMLIWILAEFLIFLYFSIFVIDSNRLSLLLMSENPITYDCISGYKYRGEKVRFIRLHDGETIFDNTFVVNNNGYVSSKDYMPKKNEEVYRFIVFGDSFTSAEYLVQNWPSRIEENMNSTNDSICYEFYSFALSGIGIANWEKQFWKEIVDIYEFDAIIFAIFGDNLQRDQLIAYSDEYGCYYNYISSDIDCANYKDFLDSEPEVFTKSENEIDDFLRNQDAKQLFNYESFVFPYIADILYSRLSAYEAKIKWDVKMRDLYSYDSINLVNHNNTLNNNSLWKFFISVKSYCEPLNTPIIFVTIPVLDLIMLNKSQEKENLLQIELKYIVDSLDFYFYDSYPTFGSLDSLSIENFFFQHDPHWNQSGSDFFEQNFRHYLQKKVILK
jgi:hypothetical protein